MALQTFTQFPTASPSSTNDASSSRDGSTTPLIPAFLIAGVLLAIIATMFGWRRVLRNRTLGVVDFDMDGGVGMPGPTTQAQAQMLAAGPAVFRMGRRYGFMGGMGGERYGGIVAMEREAALGPKPALWDVWVEKSGVAERARRGVVGGGGKWSELMPLSATICSNKLEPDETTADRPSSMYLPQQQRTHPRRVGRPYMMRQFFRRVHSLTHAESPSHQSQKPALHEHLSTPNDADSRLQIAVLIAMPNESSSVQRRLQRHQPERDESKSIISTPSTHKCDDCVVSCASVSEDSSDIGVDDSFANRGQFALGLADVSCRCAEGEGVRNLLPS